MVLAPALGHRRRWQGVSLEVCDHLDVLEHLLACCGQVSMASHRAGVRACEIESEEASV